MVKRLGRTVFMLAVVLCLLRMWEPSPACAKESARVGKQSEAFAAAGTERQPEASAAAGTERQSGSSVTAYEVKISEADGENGYYVTKPRVKISHVSRTGVTKYVLTHGNGRQKEKTLNKRGEKALIEGAEFAEGKNVLHIWMENGRGEKLEKYELVQEFLVDTKAPEAAMGVQGGNHSWRTESAVVTVEARDSGSGVSGISARTGDGSLGSVAGNRAEFTVEQASVGGNGVTVTVCVKDRAGNQSEGSCAVYIDRKVPAVSLKGADNYEITGKPATITCKVDEENLLRKFSVSAVWENKDGERRKMDLPEWKTAGTARKKRFKLSEDGIYYIDLKAEDMAGHKSEKKLQVMIDRENPVIRRVDGLQGKYLQEFCWDYSAEELIEDFTSCTCDVRLDGGIYRMGTKVSGEGRHRLTVNVLDAAGNRAQAKAEFFVDHTAPEIVFTNVEEGEEYEEKRTFQVGVAGAQDTVRQIQINGKSQAVDTGRKTYQYTLQSCKDYEVTVSAVDRAGNSSQKTVCFSIVPEKTVAEKIVTPIQSHFAGDGGSGKKSDGTERAEKETDGEGGAGKFLKAAGCSVLGAFVILGWILIWWKNPQGEKKKN